MARRFSDEKTLSLSKLDERLDSWRQQQVYQQNLLHRFLQQHAPLAIAQNNQFAEASLRMASVLTR
ncbi:MAG: biopolymer transport protein ExbB [Pseudohongiellaceae bacterium]